MALLVGLVAVYIAIFAVVFFHGCRQGREFKERAARDERQRRESAIKQEIARRRCGRERASCRETSDPAGG
ncbi:MAG: hypothetical protein F4Y41_08170 [Gammaproteobacteria bacterium]|nr:hypothetical protein [Gammaproteobacteria bacterium]